MKSLRVAVVAGLGLLAACLGPGVASAATSGYVTADLNQRAGPGVEFPRVVVIPAGSPVTIFGCLAEAPWCDVWYYGYRGWVSAHYLRGVYGGYHVVVPAYRERLGIPFVSFTVAVYWGDHYRSHPFYDDYPHWQFWQAPWVGTPYVAAGPFAYAPVNAVVTGKHRPGYVAPAAPKAKKFVAAKKKVVATKKAVSSKRKIAKAKVLGPVKKKKTLTVVGPGAGEPAVVKRKPVRRCMLDGDPSDCPPPRK